MIFHAAFEVFYDSLLWSPRYAYFGRCFSAGFALCLLLTFFRDGAQLATRLATVLALGTMVWQFPQVANHSFLVLFCLLLLALANLDREPEAVLGMRAIRWVTVIVLFYTGLKKVLMGTYFKGQFLTWTIAHETRFASIFSWILPEAELSRIQALKDSAGPFATEWWLLLVTSNFIYLAELLLPVLLLIR